MSTNPLSGIHPTGGPDDPRPSHGNPQVDDTKFRRLLEQLEQIGKGKQTGGEEKHDAEDFLDAMRKADESYSTVMELRRSLEEAFRKHHP